MWALNRCDFVILFCCDILTINYLSLRFTTSIHFFFVDNLRLNNHFLVTTACWLRRLLMAVLELLHLFNLLLDENRYRWRRQIRRYGSYWRGRWIKIKIWLFIDCMIILLLLWCNVVDLAAVDGDIVLWHVLLLLNLITIIRWINPIKFTVGQVGLGILGCLQEFLIVTIGGVWSL